MFLVTAIFLALFSVALSNNCSDVNCPKVPKHYEELGCKPVVKNGECCPQSFDCSAFNNRDRSKCYHKGRAYAIGAQIDDPQLESSCTVGCYCAEDGSSGNAIVNCAHIDCPEFFGGGGRRLPGQNCIAQYKENGCCKDRDVCDNELNALQKCTFQGKTYYEGQKIYPEGSCYKCMCAKGFEDKPVESNKHCQKINCNIDLRSSSRIYSGCVPIYYKTETCCPIDYQCPDNKVTVIKAKTSVAAPDAPQCTFGSLRLAIGDNLSSADSCKVCTCNIPPHVTCVKTC